MTDPVLLAIDCGAESGRVMAARLSDGRMQLDEVHRFDNGARAHDGHLRWDAERLLAGVENGVRIGLDRFGSAVQSVGVDTWAIDYVLLDDQEREIADPICYRDERSAGWKQRAEAIVPPASGRCPSTPSSNCSRTTSKRPKNWPGRTVC